MTVILTMLAYLKYRAGVTVVVVAPVYKPTYRIRHDIPIAERLYSDIPSTQRVRADAEVRHRITTDAG